MRPCTPCYRPVLARTTAFAQTAMAVVPWSDPRIRARVTMTLLAVGSVLALAFPVYAVDGVIEINHEKALMGGVTPSDGAGYPVMIDTTGSGSYRLTSNLIVPDANTPGIYVQGGTPTTVTIDLNGFAILGSTSCTGSPPVCSPTGVGDGILGSFVGNLVVINGTIKGMGRHGISLSGFEGSRIEGIRAISNGQSGIYAGRNSIVVSSMAKDNGDNGIFCNGGVVSKCLAINNGTRGIYVGTSTVVQGSTAYDNGTHGIEGSNSSLQGNMALGNGGDGIDCWHCSVIGNRSTSNTGFGLTGNGSTGYGENSFVNNTAGTVSGGPIEIGTNLCQTNTTCP